MKLALAIAAMVAVPITAAADEPKPVPAPAPSPSPAPAPAPAPAPGSQPAPTLPGTQPTPTQQLPATVPPESTAPGAEVPTQAPAADPAYGERPDQDVRNFPAPTGKDVVVISYPERTKKNMWVLGGMAVGGVLLSGVGLYFHLDARSASDEISANKFTGQVWTDGRQDAYDRAHSSTVVAGVLYGIGGSVLLAAAIGYIATEPKAEKITIHPHVDDKPSASALVAPTRGGAIVGGAWRW